MITIHKYTLRLIAVQSINTFQNMKPLTVQMQYGRPTLWCLVDTLQPNIDRTIYIYGTGMVIDIFKHGPLDHRYISNCYTGTVRDEGFVWHVFIDDSGEKVI